MWYSFCSVSPITGHNVGKLIHAEIWSEANGAKIVRESLEGIHVNVLLMCLCFFSISATTWE